jgi:ADP-ribose pyrophosphatase
MRPFEILDQTTVYSAFFDVVEAHVRYHDGQGEWTPPVSRLSVERGDAVAVVAYDAARDGFWFVRQFRYPLVRHEDPYPIELVAGKIDAPELAIDAARRELAEELGFRVSEIADLGAVYSSPGGMSELVHLFFAQVSDADRPDDGANFEDEHLIDECHPRATVWTWLDDGTLRDAKSVAALYRARSRWNELTSLA